MELKELIEQIEKLLPEFWNYEVSSWKIYDKVKSKAKISFIAGNDETSIINQLVDNQEDGYRFIYAYLSNYKNFR